MIGAIITKFYLNCSLDLTRLESNTRTPVLNTVNEICLGSNTIRAHGYYDVYRDLFYQKLDDLYKVRLCSIGTFQWYSLMLDLLSCFFEMFLIFFSLTFMQTYNYNLNVISLLLSYSTSLENNLTKFLIDISSFESTMIAMERCTKYADIIKEAPSHKISDFKLKNWPSKGNIQFINYSVQYRANTKNLLDKISFEIKAGEKIGIVGRTGCGKSTIALAIGRIIEGNSGSIIIDGIDIKKIGLTKLRSSLNIISQDLSLFEGTLRYNIDPLGKHTDKEIKDTMKQVNCYYIREQNPIIEGGLNYQRVKNI